MKLHRYVDHQRLHIVTKDVISLSISVLLLFRHYISHKITFGAPSSGGVFCSACGAFISLIQPLSPPPPPPPPLDPRRPLHMLYIYIMTFNYIKGILSLGGGKHLKQIERHQVHLFNDKHHYFKYITYAGAVGILQSFGNEGHL